MANRTLQLDDALYDYVLAHSLREHPAQAALREATRSHPHAVMQIGPEQGQFMALLVRLMGGMAIRAHAPDWPARTRRVEVDLDFATRSRDRGAFYELLASEGYTADKRHNALFGGKQAYFVDVARNRPVDVLVDNLEMCHRFAFGARLSASSPTLPLAELLLSKLQVVKINRKDVLDALRLLLTHEPGAGDSLEPVDGEGVLRHGAIAIAS